MCVNFIVVICAFDGTLRTTSYNIVHHVYMHRIAAAIAPAAKYPATQTSKYGGDANKQKRNEQRMVSTTVEQRDGIMRDKRVENDTMVLEYYDESSCKGEYERGAVAIWNTLCSRGSGMVLKRRNDV